MQSTSNPPSAQIRGLQMTLAEAILANGDAPGAEAACTALRNASEASEPSLQGRVLTCLGQASLAQGRKKEARQFLVDAVAAFASGEQDHRLGVALFALARLKSESRALQAEAMQDAQAALQRFTEAGPAWASERLAVEAWLKAQSEMK
jgi:hypothetical protein